MSLEAIHLGGKNALVTGSSKALGAAIAANLTAISRLSQFAAQQIFKEGTKGKLLNIASSLSFQGGILVPPYAAAKGDVAQLTKALANEWASKGIHVNAIAAGYMLTDSTAALRNDFLCATAKFSRVFRLPVGAIRRT